MLTSLHIKNYVIIDELMLDFQQGMTVISGETGAGKSIIIDALELAVGGRSETQIIKSGETRCEITTSFDVTQNISAKSWLLEQELLSEQSDYECIIRRIITQDGRSKITINGQIFPAQKVRELAQYLVDIHGQHEHQALFRTETHRTQLDTYAQHLELVELVAKNYQECQKLKIALEDLSSSLSEVQSARKTLLEYQLEELVNAQIQEEEIKQLHADHLKLSQTDVWTKNIEGILEILTDNSEISIQKLLYSALNLIPHAKNLPESWTSLKNLLENAKIQCQEAETEAKQLLKTMEIDPERLAQIEKRLQLLHALARKHHVSMEELSELQKKLTNELEQLEKNQERKKILEDELSSKEKVYHENAQKLSESRHKKAKLLGEAITDFMHSLGLTHGQLTIMLESEPKLSANGYDKVEYYVAMNPNQQPRPLIKTASGGELSRISLAIEVVTQKEEDITRLFDEVDVGIGGKAAAVVGNLLRQLGEKSQVLCITHQPQTASQGHHHFYVEKTIHQKEGKSTAVFQVSALDYGAKVQEIARMLGGMEMTENTLAHAKDLISAVV